MSEEQRGITAGKAFRNFLREHDLVDAWVDERRKSVTLKSIFPICEVVGGKIELLSDKSIEGAIKRNSMILHKFNIYACYTKEYGKHKNHR